MISSAWSKSVVGVIPFKIMYKNWEIKGSVIQRKFPTVQLNSRKGSENYIDRTCWAAVHGDHYITGTVPGTEIGWGCLQINDDCYVTITVDHGSTSTIILFNLLFVMKTFDSFSSANWWNTKPIRQNGMQSVWTNQIGKFGQTFIKRLPCIIWIPPLQNVSKWAISDCNYTQQSFIHYICDKIMQH